MRINIIFLFVLFLFSSCNKELEVPEKVTFDSAYVIDFADVVKDKNFFFLSKIQQTPEVRDILESDEILSTFFQKYRLAFAAARENCDNEVNCIDQLLQLKAEDIEKAGQALGALVNAQAFRKMIQEHLRPSGMFIRYDSLSDAALVETVWRDAASGINRILKVYGLGENPRYTEIDRVSYEVDTEVYKNLLQQKLTELSQQESSLFFEPTLAYAMGLLAINNRDEAGKFEPLRTGANSALIENLPSINWEEYDYSLILVLGDSPNSPGDLPNISIGGMARADHGVQLFEQGKAPILAFSGGCVRPFQTPYSEAIEMKKYVMEKYGLSENQILVDPHARHTTTNLRNISRMVFRYGIPANKKAIVTTSTQHSEYTTSSRFHDRCLEELGYLPVQLLGRLNNIDIEFLPKKISLQADANDPLDP